MEYISNQTEFKYEHTVVALGKFEGLHRGHQLLFDQLRQYGDQGYKKVVFTFDMPPKSVIAGENERVIYTKEERWRKLERFQMDVLVEYPFAKLRGMSPLDFIEKILIGQLDAKIIVVGEDFGFGYQRAGNVALLQELAPKFGYELVVISKLKIHGEEVSSSRIRACIERGDLKQANELLGGPFSVVGPVVHGRKLGRMIGMPTANQEPLPHKYLPPNGVYVAEIHIDKDVFHGISNIGVKPTIDDNIAVGIETYLFDYNKDIYGKVIEVSLLSFVRPEMKFDSVDHLSAQMQKDAQTGREYFQTRIV